MCTFLHFHELTLHTKVLQIKEKYVVVFIGKRKESEGVVVVVVGKREVFTCEKVGEKKKREGDNKGTRGEGNIVLLSGSLVV